MSRTMRTAPACDIFNRSISPEFTNSFSLLRAFLLVSPEPPLGPGVLFCGGDGTPSFGSDVATAATASSGAAASDPAETSSGSKHLKIGELNNRARLASDLPKQDISVERHGDITA